LLIAPARRWCINPGEGFRGGNKIGGTFLPEKSHALLSQRSTASQDPEGALSSEQLARVRPGSRWLHDRLYIRGYSDTSACLWDRLLRQSAPERVTADGKFLGNLDLAVIARTQQCLRFFRSASLSALGRPPTRPRRRAALRPALTLWRNLIRERTIADLKAARARGRKGGRPAKLSPKEIKTVSALLKTTDGPVSEIA